MKEEQIKKFHKRLQSLREEIIKVMDWRESAAEKGEGLDEIDQANDLIEREMGYVMSSNMRSNLDQVDEALTRITDRTFGKCLHCGLEISIKRLEVLPFARFCVPCQEKLESRAR
jgi:DnaK suppressor protein